LSSIEAHTGQRTPATLVAVLAGEPYDVDFIEFIGDHADVWRWFRDGRVFARVVSDLASPLGALGLTKIAGVEARGFILGAAVASRLSLGFAAIRKSGGLYPGPKVVGATTTPDYRGMRHSLRLQRAAVEAGDRVVLVDDWAETGNQALAARSMIEECGGLWAGLSVVVDQLSDERRAALEPVRALTTIPV
jgi:adenine phosphoribosyltransferase